MEQNNRGIFEILLGAELQGPQGHTWYSRFLDVGYENVPP